MCSQTERDHVTTVSTVLRMSKEHILLFWMHPKLCSISSFYVYIDAKNLFYIPNDESNNLVYKLITFQGDFIKTPGNMSSTRG